MAYDSAGNAVTNDAVPGEWLFSELDYRYTRESGTVQNDATKAGTAADLALTKGELVGQPILKAGSQWEFATAAEVTSADPIGDGGTEEWGFVISGEDEAAMAADDVSAVPWALLVRGPAIINQGQIPALDVYGGSIVVADYVTLCKKLGIAVINDPATTTTQVNQ